MLSFRQWLAEGAPTRHVKWWYNHDTKTLYNIGTKLHHAQWAYFYGGSKLHLSSGQRLDIAKCSRKGTTVSDVPPSSLVNNSRVVFAPGQ